MSKSFNIARKPGQGLPDTRPDVAAEETSPVVSLPPSVQVTPTKPKKELGTGPTTRKTIEVPEDYFFQVKLRALNRKMKEKDLWAEILREYFMNHPTL
jgi:hypothetical protein